MGQYNTKFNLNDTAYFVDSNSLNIVSGIITDVYIHHSQVIVPLVAYILRFTNVIQNKTKYNENELFYLEEAKTEVSNLLSKRESDIGNLH